MKTRMIITLTPGRLLQPGPAVLGSVSPIEKKIYVRPMEVRVVVRAHSQELGILNSTRGQFDKNRRILIILTNDI
jgi:hypothetical protein